MSGSFRWIWDLNFGILDLKCGLCFDTKTKSQFRIEILPCGGCPGHSSKGHELCGLLVLSIRGINRTSISGGECFSISFMEFFRFGCNFPLKTKKELKKKEEEAEQYMVKNGGMVLEELISTGNGRYNPIRNFSAKQILEATNNFHSPCFSTEDYWFRASLNNRPVLIRKFDDSYVPLEEACRDIAISSQMSSHSRALKLLGCCLEFPVPVMVYEDAEIGPLDKHGRVNINGSSLALPWKTRLRIAKDIANALTYFHSAFSRPIIHRDVKPSNVLLDKDFVPKLCNFSLSLSIPEGETGVENDVLNGTLGFLDPVYGHKVFVTEQSDVYSFGVFLLVLLSGKPAVYEITAGLHGCISLVNFAAEKPWNEIVDSKILEEEGVTTEKQQKLQDFLNLALKCTQDKGEDRPMMIDVAKELVRIHSSTPAP